MLSTGTCANRAFLDGDAGEPGGEEGVVVDRPISEGVTSTMTGVTVCLPRDEGMVNESLLIGFAV